MNKFFKGLVNLLIWLGIILSVYNSLTWKDSVKNPDNDEFVTEVAYNRGIEKHEVKQWMFNQRYETKRIIP